MKKVKITSFEYGVYKAKIVNINGWWELDNAINNNGIIHDNVVKAEILPEAEEHNIIDTTNPN